MLSKKVLALLIPTMFSGLVLAESASNLPTGEYAATSSGQVVFSGEVSAVACTLRIPSAVSLVPVGQAEATGATNHNFVGTPRTFSIALQNCTFQTAGSVTGVIALKDAAETTDSFDETLTNTASGEAAQGVGVQIRYFGKSPNTANPVTLQFKDKDVVLKSEDFGRDDGAYEFHFDAAIRRMGDAQVFAGAVEAKMDVEVAYK